jgi:hypothetical protein
VPWRTDDELEQMEAELEAHSRPELRPS